MDNGHGTDREKKELVPGESSVLGLAVQIAMSHTGVSGSYVQLHSRF